MNNRNKLSTDQRGIMAIVVTVLIMTVLSITTLAMARMARREQRQSLDATMSVQATYAVESGINDSLQYLSNPAAPPISLCSGVGDVNTTTDTNNAQLRNTMTIPSFVSTNPAELDLGGYTATTSYTCALVSNTATTLNYTVTDSSVANISVPLPGQNTLTIGWQSDNNNNFRPDPCAQTLPTNWSLSPGSPLTPMLRVDITNLSGGFSRASMAANTGTFYLNPCVTGTATNTFASGYGSGNPQIINGSCVATPTTTPRKCTATISGFSYTKLLVRLHSVYGTPANVSISAAGVAISDAQATIDVTAKSTDVVKRVRQSYSLTPTGSLGDNQSYLYAIESQNAICKRLQSGIHNGILNPFGTYYESNNVAGNDQDVCNPNQL